MDGRTASFTYKGNQIAYEDYGEGEHVVLYMHGLLLHSGINRAIAKSLADTDCRVILLDLLGHGASDKPGHASAYRIDTYAEQVFAVMDHLGVGEAILGGLSLGANVSLFAASQRPERVRGLVIEMPVLEWAVPAAASLFAPLLLAAHYGRSVLRVTSGLFARIPRTPFGSVNACLDAVATPPEAMAAILHGVLVGPVAPTIEARKRIDVPTLVLAHTNDLIHPFDDAVNLAEQMPHATLVRAHSPLELRLRPDRLTMEISNFVDQVWEPDPVSAAG